MTAVVGYRDITNGRAYIAADGRAIDGWDIIPLSDGKLFWKAKGRMLVSSAGGGRADQLVRYNIDLDDQPPDKGEGVEYLAKVFVPRLQSALDEHKASMKTDDGSRTHFIVSMNGRLFHIDEELFATEVDAPLVWTGAAGAAAAGAFAGMRHYGKHIEDTAGVQQQLTEALRIAETMNATVGPPYHVGWTER